MPPKKLWLARNPVTSTQRPPQSSSNPDVRDRESIHGPEAATSKPSDAPSTQQIRDLRATDSDVTLPPSSSEQSLDSLQTGCFEAMRNALRCSVINLVAPRRRRRRASRKPSSKPKNESVTGLGQESTRRGSDDKPNRGTRRRPFDPEASGDSESGCSPRKRALSAAPEAQRDKGKRALQWADLEEPTMSGFADVSGEKAPDTWMASERDVPSEDTVGYPGNVFKKAGESSFSGLLPEALKRPESYKPPEPVKASLAFTSPPVFDVDKMLMPPPPVPWLKIARQKIRQLTSDSTSHMPSSSFFSAYHFHSTFKKPSQSVTSSQSSPSEDATPKVTRPRTLSLCDPQQEQGMPVQARRRSYSWCSEGQYLRQNMWGETRKEFDPSSAESDVYREQHPRSFGAHRTQQFGPTSHAPTSLSAGDVTRSEYRERRHDFPDISKLSLEAQRETGCFPERQYHDRVPVRVRKDGFTFPMRLRHQSLPNIVSSPNVVVSQDGVHSEFTRSVAPRELTSEVRQGSGWKSVALLEQDGSSRESAINLDDINVPAAFETQDRRLPRPPVGIHPPETWSLHHDTAANLAELVMLPAASVAPMWVPTRTASSVTATDYPLTPQTPADANAMDISATIETQEHGPAAHFTGTAMPTAEPGETATVPTKTASPTKTTDFATTTHTFLSW